MYSMSHTTKITIAVITAFVSIITVITATPMTQASGQFAPIESGAVYTSEDIAAGKAEHLSEIQPFAVTSESMYPLFKVGEMAAMNYSVPFASIEEGDIIVFDSPVGHVSHRVIEIETEEDGSRIITTLGDNNNGISIPGVDTDITAERYIGKVIVTTEEL
jgi:signal peptidase I